MKKLIPFLIVISVLVLSTAEKTFPQEESSLSINNTQYMGNNTADPNDVSGMPEERVLTPQEINLMTEIKRIKQADDRSQLNRLLELESELEALNPYSISKLGEYQGGVVGKPFDAGNSFTPEDIGNIEIYNSGSLQISAIATATEQRGTTAGRIWTALALRTTAAHDTIRIFYSDDGGVNWTWYGWGHLGGTDRLNRDDMDMEIIENDTGEKYIWITYGYRNTAGTGEWRTGGLIFQSPTFQGNFFALSWPGVDPGERYYGLRITSDNANYLTVPYVYMVASFDSVNGANHDNSQKTVRCTSPYTTTPTFSYKTDRFYYHTGGASETLHADIAYFQRNGADSIIVSYSNIPDNTKIFFAKSNITNGPGGDGSGGIGGNTPTLHKQYGRLASNGNDNGRIVCVFRVNNTPWQVRYFRTINWGNFKSMINGGPLAGNTPNTSYQPDIVGVRGATTSYISFRVDGSIDSVYLTKVAIGFTTLSSRMNSVTSVSGVQGPKPGFRYADGDSCFVIYAPNGPFDVWAAAGCSGPPVTVMTPVLVAPPDNAIDVSINPTLTWNSVPDATDYHLRVYLNNTTLVVDEPNVGSTSLAIGPLDYLSMYTWEVAANYSFGTGPFAARFTFNTMAAPPGVEEITSGIPSEFSLFNNYPNPFNPATTIYYALQEASSVELIVYDVLGNEFMKYVEDQQAAGYHKVNFDATGFNSGIYFYQLQAGDFVDTKKMILLK